MRWISYLLVLILVIGLLGCSAKKAMNAPRVKVSVSEKRIAILPPSAQLHDRDISPDGTRTALYLRESAEKWYAIIDGIRYGPYNGVRGLEETFTPDSQHAMYMVFQGDGEYAVIDGKKEPIFQHINTISSPPPIPAYMATPLKSAAQEEPGDRVLMVKGKQYPTEGNVRYFKISQDGSHIAYVAKRHEAEYAVIDGKRGPAFRHISMLKFSADNTMVAYLACHMSFNPDTVVIDGVVREYDRLKHLSFAARGHHIAYTAFDGKDWYTFIDGKRGRAYDDISTLAFRSPEDYSYAASRDGHDYVVVNGKEFQLHPSEIHRLYTSDLTHQASVFEQQYLLFFKRKAVRHDGSMGEFYSDVNLLEFSADGRHFVYLASQRMLKDVRVRLVVDGKASKSYRLLLQLEGAGRSYFTPDNRHCVYYAQRDDRGILGIDGDEVAMAGTMISRPVLAGSNIIACFTERKLADGRRDIYLTTVRILD